MRSEFESYFRKTLFYSNMLSSAAENGIAISPFEVVRGQYRNTYVQLAYSVYSHQQSKVDELQKQKSLQELEINQIAHANQQWQLNCGELQKRVDAATAKWISIISILTTTESNVPDVIYQQLDELHDALCGYELEQALKGTEP